ncbi:MAG: type III secretion system chaperone [Spirulinaceae cyanobacterium]
MKIAEIISILQEVFPSKTLQHESEDSWQVDPENLRLLILLTEDGSELRLLVPIAPQPEAQPYLEQLLASNFEQTKQARYALERGVLWGVYNHNLDSLTKEDFQEAIATIVELKNQGLSEVFNHMIEQRLKQIIQAAKLQGQSLEATLQTIERFYQEGMLGGLDQSSEERERFITAWQQQLKRLWPEVEP